MKKKASNLSFKVSFEQPPKEEISLVGFLFYCNGIFLQQQLVRDGLLEFAFTDYSKDSGEKLTWIRSNCGCS